MLQKYKLHL